MGVSGRPPRGFNSFRIVKIDTFTWQPDLSGSAFDLLTIPHNLGYSPVALVYASSNDGTTFSPFPFAATITVSGGTLEIQDYFTSSTDETNLYIRNSSSLSNPRPTRSFKYFLLKETADQI